MGSIAEPEIRDLVVGAIYTGMRYAELAGLSVLDVHLDSASVLVQQSKSDKGHAVFLNEEGIERFDRLCAGRASAARVFEKSNGTPWGKSQQTKRMAVACEIAKIEPALVFHGLRHTYASLYLMAGGGLSDLAKQLGHSSTAMVERYYGHLADAWRAERARQFAPSLGFRQRST